MKPNLETFCSPLEPGHTNRVVVEPAGTEFTLAVAVQLLAVTEAAVGTRAGLCRLEVDLGLFRAPEIEAVG